MAKSDPLSKHLTTDRLRVTSFLLHQCLAFGKKQLHQELKDLWDLSLYVKRRPSTPPKRLSKKPRPASGILHRKVASTCNKQRKKTSPTQSSSNTARVLTSVENNQTVLGRKLATPDLNAQYDTIPKVLDSNDDQERSSVGTDADSTVGRPISTATDENIDNRLEPGLGPSGSPGPYRQSILKRSGKEENETDSWRERPKRQKMSGGRIAFEHSKETIPKYDGLNDDLQHSLASSPMSDLVESEKNGSGQDYGTTDTKDELPATSVHGESQHPEQDVLPAGTDVSQDHHTDDSLLGDSLSSSPSSHGIFPPAVKAQPIKDDLYGRWLNSCGAIKPRPGRHAVRPPRPVVERRRGGVDIRKPRHAGSGRIRHHDDPQSYRSKETAISSATRQPTVRDIIGRANSDEMPQDHRREARRLPFGDVDQLHSQSHPGMVAKSHPSSSAFLHLPDNYFKSLQKFREDNRELCFRSRIPQQSTKEALIPHHCIHDYQINERLFAEPLSIDVQGNSKCIVCSRSSKQVTDPEPVHLRVTVPSTALLPPSAAVEGLWDYPDPNSMALTRNCRSPNAPLQKDPCMLLH